MYGDVGSIPINLLQWNFHLMLLIKASNWYSTELQLQSCGSELCHFLLGNFSCYLVPLEVTVTKTKIQILEIVLRFLFGCLLSKVFPVLQHMHV